jgi:RNA polymerase sigma factor (sigma-70 family)
LEQIPTTPAVRPTEAEIIRFVDEVQVEASRLVAHRFGPYVADEVVGVLGERVAREAEALMAKFGSGMAYARAAANNAALDVLRRDRGQRGEGAALVVDAEGQLRARRTVLAGDATIGDGDETVFSQCGAVDGGIEAVLEAVDRGPVVEAVLALLNDQQRAVFVLVEGYGFEVAEAAVLLGVARETASRRLSVARRIIRGAVGPDQFGLAA